MAWIPISGTVPQFTVSGEQALGYVLKFYDIGTVTPMTVSSSASGTPTTTEFVLDAQGYTTLSTVRVIPHVESGYKVVLYLNQADADANATGSAVFVEDNITISGTTGGFISVDNVTQLAAVNTTFFKTALVKGTSAVDDGGQATFYFDANSVAADNGTTIIEPDSGTGRWLMLNVETLWLGDSSVTTSKMAANSVVGNVLQLGLEWKTGLLVSNNATDAEHDIDVAAGQIMDDTNTYRMNCQAITKRIDAAFAVGTGNGGLASADSLGNNTWYGVFELHKSASASVAADSDVIFATTRARALASTGVTGVFDICRLVGAVLTDGSANIIAFKYGGDDWSIWDVLQSVSISPSTGGTDVVIPTPPNMLSKVVYAGDKSSSISPSEGLLTQTDQTNTGPTTTLFDIRVRGDGSTNLGDSIVKDIKTDTQSEIRHRENSGFSNVLLSVIGWKFLPTVTDLV